ncbi:MAG: universal stress protein [Thermoleophilia bacterium]
MLPPRILVATDGSPAAKAAEAFAAETAVAQHASAVVIVTVNRIFIGRAPAMVPITVDEVEAGEQLVKEAAEHVREVMGDDSIPVETKVLESASEAGAIIAEAHATDVCTHIVMGARGMGGIASLLLGSTSHQVIQGAHCPVTIIRV